MAITQPYKCTVTHARAGRLATDASLSLDVALTALVDAFVLPQPLAGSLGFDTAPRNTAPRALAIPAAAFACQQDGARR